MYSRTARVSIVRWNLKEAVSKSLVRRTEIAYKARPVSYTHLIFGFFYNKTLFAKAGIEAVPTTWAEFDAVCKKLVDAGITPITGDTTYQTSTLGYHLGRYLGQDLSLIHIYHSQKQRKTNLQKNISNFLKLRRHLRIHRSRHCLVVTSRR